MKLTKSRLKQIIKEELSQIEEMDGASDVGPDPRGDQVAVDVEPDTEEMRQERISKLHQELERIVARKHRIEADLQSLGAPLEPDPTPF
tara:strand:+ start:431 stop:697 length:267 start_codon:yes stop_codon:yes gene_type:complete